MRKKNRALSSEVERFFPSEKVGLTTEQIAKRNEQGLNNDVKDENAKSYFKIIFDNTFTFFNLLCLICFIALVSVKANIADFSFVVIYLTNIVLGIVQEIRAKIKLQKLSIVSAPTTKAIRNGKTVEIPLKDIVLDDILVLEIGNQIPADCVLISGKLEVNESLLTGESIPVKKSVGDSLLGGSFVSGGNCVCRVEKIGNDCYVQQLSLVAKMHKSPNSKLLNSLNLIIKTVGILIVPIAVVMGIINYQAFVNTFSGAELIKEVVIHTSSVIIGMIPAGMFLLTTMALAVGVIKLGKMNTLVQEMYSLEMLARVDTLCLDKTGTITDGRMEVTEIVKINDYAKLSVSDAIYAMEYALQDKNQTANALRDYFTEGPTLDALSIIPFTSQRKFSAVSFPTYGTFVLGAPNYIFETLPDSVSAQINTYARLGRRVIMLAHSAKTIDNEKIPTDLKPLSLIIIEDNIRKEAIETIAWFKANDVHVKVISGDDPLTVSEISKRAGIDNAENYVNLNGLDEQTIYDIADKYTVFGRVSPEQKAILVKALKNQGHTVAMTGDGVNDILAMKEADCSVTVASGSSAARSVAHLVLLDNNFNSMPKVVTEGRRVINNIQQSSSLYLMKTLFTMAFAIISIIGFKEYPFTPRMMLVLEAIIIGLPSFFLSLQPNNARVEGNFISKVFTNATPGALILVLNVFVIQLITKYTGLAVSEELRTSMEVVIMTFGGWAFLVNLCKPFDTYRGVMLCGVTIVLGVWVCFLLDSSFFNIASFSPFKENWQYILIMAFIIQCDFPILSLAKTLIEKGGKLISKINADKKQTLNK